MPQTHNCGAGGHSGPHRLPAPLCMQKTRKPSPASRGSAGSGLGESLGARTSPPLLCTWTHCPQAMAGDPPRAICSAGGTGIWSPPRPFHQSGPEHPARPPTSAPAPSREGCGRDLIPGGRMPSVRRQGLRAHLCCAGQAQPCVDTVPTRKQAPQARCVTSVSGNGDLLLNSTPPPPFPGPTARLPRSQPSRGGSPGCPFGCEKGQT